VYYLTQVGLAGRDIMWNQNYRHNLNIRKGLENVNQNYKGDRENIDFKSFKTFLKEFGSLTESTTIIQTIKSNQTSQKSILQTIY
jgi:hypothetical protein